jgi:DNA-directed RNA polymerase subunit beta'
MGSAVVTLPLTAEPLVQAGEIVVPGRLLAAEQPAEHAGQVGRVLFTEEERTVLLRVARPLTEVDWESLWQGEAIASVSKLTLGRKSGQPLRLQRCDREGRALLQYILTTPGRVIFNHTIHQALTR